MSSRTHYVGNRWIDGEGHALPGHDPASGEFLWQGKCASNKQVAQAVDAARAALGDWSRRSLDERAEFLKVFAKLVTDNRDRFAEAISRQTGKPKWESLTEADAMAAKVGISIEVYHQRRGEERRNERGVMSVTRYKPVGVAAVLGPFNLPGHLPNGHIVPALLAGNTVVFKPSELAPLVGEITAELWEMAGLPAGVFNMIQGGRETGAALCASTGVDAIFFTGSHAGGRAISRAVADRPEVLVALEMGGNNPLVAWDVKDKQAAAYGAAVSAFITAGQRCSCARRLIVSDDDAGREIVDRVTDFARRMRVGRYTDRPEPFMGPVISAAAAQRVLAAQNDMMLSHAAAILPAERIGSGGMIRPGLIDITTATARRDEEVFGPLLSVIRVKDFAAAIDEANRTAYGLSAGIMTDRAELYEQFRTSVRAGVINWNRPLTGASSRAPFGGVGRSGNHRPSASFATDYCSYPVASLESETLAVPAKLEIGIDS